MDAYLSSRNGLALKYSGAATRACGIRLPSFSKRRQPLHSPQTTFFRTVAIFFRAVTGAVFSIASMRLSARGCSFLSGHVPFLLPVCPVSACPTPGPPTFERCPRMGHSRSTSPASPRLSLRATPTSAEALPSTQKG